MDLPKKRKTYSKDKESQKAFLDKFRQVAAVSELVDCFREVIEYDPAILSLVNDIKKKSISNWKWPEVARHFGLGPNETLTNLPLPKCQLPEVITKKLEARFEDTIYSHGPIDSGKEVRKNQFINDVLVSIISFFKGRIRIEDEGELNSLDTNGTVEFVIYARDTSIIFVVECKMSDMIQGKAQMLLELTAASWMNRSQGFEMIPLYGAVTSGDVWRFYCYDGKNFSESSKLFMGTSLTGETTFLTVTQAVYYWIVNSWVRFLAQLAEIWKRDAPEDPKTNRIAEAAQLAKEKFLEIQNATTVEEANNAFGKLLQSINY